MRYLTEFTKGEELFGIVPVEVLWTDGLEILDAGMLTLILRA